MSLLRADRIANRYNNTGPIIVGPGTVHGDFTITGDLQVAGIAVTNGISVGLAVTANRFIAGNLVSSVYANVSGVATIGIVTGATYYGSGQNIVGVATLLRAGSGIQLNGGNGSATNNIIISTRDVRESAFATTAGVSTNLVGGDAGRIPYQTAADTTSFTATGTSGEILQSTGTGAPIWTSLAAINVAYADSAGISTDIFGGSAGRLVYQSGVDQTSFVPVGASGRVLVAQGSLSPSWVDPRVGLSVSFAKFAGVSTNVTGGIGSVTHLSVGENGSGIATFFGPVLAEDINVTGILTAVDMRVSSAATIDSLTLQTGPGVGVTAILDEDDMVSDRADALATQQSIKAYVDSQVTAQDLDVSTDDGTIAIDLDSEVLGIVGASNEIYITATGNDVTVGLNTDVTVENNLTVTGNAGIGSLSVTGISTLETLGVSGVTTTQFLDVTGIATVSTLGITGVTTSENLSVAGVATVSTLGVTGVTTSENLSVAGISTLNRLTVSGIATFTNDVVIGAGNTVFNGDFSNSNLTGVSTVAQLQVTGLGTFTDTTDNTLGDVDSGAVQIDGGAGIAKNLTVGAGLTATNLNVSSGATFSSGPVFIGTETSTGDSSQVLQLSGDVYFSGNLGIGETQPVGVATTTNTSVLNVGVVTANFFYGDGSKLTNVEGFPDIDNLLYVAKNGDDTNPGTRLSAAKRTVGAALTLATAGSVIKVSAGTYEENNPLKVPAQVSIIGDSLRDVTIVPQNANQDLFHVKSGDYISDMSFTGTMNSDKAVIAFDPDSPDYNIQSPYIRNCTNFINESIGMKIDGKDSIGRTKSMVVDSYTQYNQGGIGVSITNEGYAQLVSIFTICSEIAIFCGSGGACDLTNSNSSFGDFGLIAEGVGAQNFIGTITSAADAGASSFTINVGVSTLGVSTAEYNNVVGLLTVTTNSNHGFVEGQSVEIRDLEFECTSGPGIVTYPSGNYGYVFTVESVGAANSFSAYVGVSTLSHGYVRAGVVSTFVTTPYDGQVIYLEDLYYTVDSINITNRGSGYTSGPPTVTIGAPGTTWGINATATATVTGGIVDEVNIISNGRGYSSTPPSVEFSAPTVGINTAEGTAKLLPTYYVISESTPIVNGICTITTTENVPYAVGVGTTVPLFKQSRILASSHSFEYIGSGTSLNTALPQDGGVAIQANEIVERDGGLVIYTSTDQAGNFRIGDGVVINQQTGTISGDDYTRSLFATMTPFILALGGD